MQIRQVEGGTGNFCQNPFRLHFGLGPRSQIDRIEVRWQGGGVDVLEDIPADQILTIHEGTGRGGIAP